MAARGRVRKREEGSPAAWAGRLDGRCGGQGCHSANLSAGPTGPRETVRGHGCTGPPGKARAPQQLLGCGTNRPSFALVCVPPELQVETWEGDRVEEGGSAKCCTYGVSGSAALPAQVRWHGLGPRRGAVRVVSQR